MAKKSRWFSWHEACSTHLVEWHATRMLLSWNDPDAIDPDDSEASGKTLQALRDKQLGGLKLGLQCMSDTVFKLCHVIFSVGKPCWSWYGWRLKRIVSSQQHLGYNVEMATTWRNDWHLRQIAWFMSKESWMEFDWLVDDNRSRGNVATWVGQYVPKLLGSRAATLSKHDAPPYAYAPLLGDDPHAADVAVWKMSNDLRILLSLETSASPGAQSLASDCRLCFDSVTRLMAFHFEREQWRKNCDAGLDILRLICGNFADSKIVEDLHSDIRKLQKRDTNQKISSWAVQNTVISSKVLKKRQWKHPAAVTKKNFLQKWNSTSNKFGKDKFRGQAGGGLPGRWSLILDKVQTWPTVSERSMAVSFAAFAWARRYWDQSYKLDMVKLQDCLV